MPALEFQSLKGILVDFNLLVRSLAGYKGSVSIPERDFS